MVLSHPLRIKEMVLLMLHFFFQLCAEKRAKKKKIDFRPYKVLRAPHEPAVWVPAFFLFFFLISHTTWTTIAAENLCGREGVLKNDHGARQ